MVSLMTGPLKSNCLIKKVSFGQVFSAWSENMHVCIVELLFLCL